MPEHNRDLNREWARLLLTLNMLPQATQNELLTQFHDVARQHSGNQKARIDVLDSILSGLDREIAVHLSDCPPSLVTPVAEGLTERLRAHHASQAHPLERKGFEAACVDALTAAGIPVYVPESGTHAKWDLRVGFPPGERWALKTAGAADIEGGHVTVSKLTEARWIQQAEGSVTALQSGIQEYAAEYVSTVQRILMLRHYQSPTGVRTYQLLEIPTALLLPLVDMDRKELQAVLQRSATIRVPLPERRDFEIDPAGGEQEVLFSERRRRRGVSSGWDFAVRLDRSDGKVTLAGIPLAACIVHGAWTLLPVHG